DRVLDEPCAQFCLQRGGRRTQFVMAALRASSRSCFAASPQDFSAISHWLSRQTSWIILPLSSDRRATSTPCSASFSPSSATISSPTRAASTSLRCPASRSHFWLCSGSAFQRLLLTAKITLTSPKVGSTRYFATS